ncbi:MAG: UbiA family prenyltransferase [FCB group bacterium]|nr:UbiA family prenyltransferase [FCB group bacterium]
MSNLIETLKIIRPVNCVLAMVGVYVGADMTWLTPAYYAVGVSALATFLVCASGNIINDMVDVEIDRINRPDRVLVKGTLSKRYLFILAILFDITAVAIAYTVNMEVTLLAVVAIALLFIYNYHAKKIPVLGNVIIAFLAALTFITGGVAIDYDLAFYLPGPIIAALFAFFFHLVREMVKDVQDLQGDRQVGIKTLPQVIGVQKSLLIALGLFFLMVLCTYIPILEGWFGKWYKIITVYVVDLPLLAFLIFLWGNPSPRMLKVGSLLLKLGMGLGIIALWIR